MSAEDKFVEALVEERMQSIGEWLKRLISAGTPATAVEVEMLVTVKYDDGYIGQMQIVVKPEGQ